jgi:hypothetical protein
MHKDHAMVLYNWIPIVDLNTKLVCHINHVSQTFYKMMITTELLLVFYSIG